MSKSTQRIGTNKNLSRQLVWRNFLQKHNLPDVMPDYSSKAYWQARYEMQQSQTQEWYIGFAGLKSNLLEFLNPTMQILELGSGNSQLIDKLWEHGYKNITGSDFSWKLINQRKQQEKMLKRGIKWQILDVTKEWPKNNKLNCIIQKGVLDCLSSTQMDQSLRLIYNALDISGLFIHISSAKPQKRVNLSNTWDIQIFELQKMSIPLFKQVDKSNVYYLYKCQKIK